MMNGRDCVKQVMEDMNVSNAELAGRLGVTQATLWDRLNNKKVKSGLSAALVSEMLRAMDYKVIVVPRSSRVPAGGYELD